MSTARFTHDTDGTGAAAWQGLPEWDDAAGLDLVDLDGEPCRRLVVLAAHPDDESLGAGGLLAIAHGWGIEVRVVLATRGEASHPRSRTTTPADLAGARLAESHTALRAVAPGGTLECLDLPDGDLAEHEEALVQGLVRAVGDGRGTLLVAPWRHDGHPDHEAAGRAAAVAARRCGARLVEYPVWFWHWGAPSGLPWAGVRLLALGPAAHQAKAASVRAHRTQVAPLSDLPGDETLLSPGLLAHFERSHETFLELAAHDTALDRLHQDADDPWGVDSRWFEERKRDLVLACLPARRYAAAWEAGCSTGALAAALATRCDQLSATDSSASAVAAARRRLEGDPAVRVQHRDLVDPWPADTFDLVVASEVGYFLSPRDLERFAVGVEDALRPDGVLVVCHWRHEIVGWPLDGPDVHRLLAGRPGWSEQARYADADVEILVLARRDVMPRSDT
ncbi:MAG: PIG-L family deacetylase [Nocardioides sp.]|nr:PIG-L family deacetylase [Nocardioides sp.]